jgi:Fe-S cluster assembly ATP-binding protein
VSDGKANGTTPMFEIENLHAEIDGKEILKGVDLVVNQGEIHALMGPNGSGKSTLAYVIAGDPRYEVTEGSIRFEGEDILEWSPDERARKGLFLAFQYPTVIPGVSMANFLRMAVTNVRNARADEVAAKGGSVERMTPREFRRLMREKMALLKIDDAFATRYLNEGFSGGEKKRAEILQMALLEPKLAVLDETDSGLDIDALRIVAEGVNAMRGDERGFLIITHYTRILEYVKPDFVHILLDGRIVREGGSELADELEEKGYEFVREGVAASGA